ncbi:hypothetical protein [Bradyrhizobium amphicarpaeae]|uniref:hypothetical protein n=1 Tax=Bradyrhizobium amphicarpaeae TaxID=1404768 RepID=UPI001FCEAC83|nr:hypothetical protein [Bradyrhizobium amphicarpaeae]
MGLKKTPLAKAYSLRHRDFVTAVQETNFRSSILFSFHSAGLYVGHPSHGGGRSEGLDALADRQGAGAKLVGMFEVILTRRKRFGWRWQVCDQSGKIFADGFERTRPSAKYQGERALFFLLSQAYHLRNRSAAASED